MVNGSLLCEQIRRGLLSIRFVGVGAGGIHGRVPVVDDVACGIQAAISSADVFGRDIIVLDMAATTLYQFLFPFLAALAGGARWPWNVAVAD
ncbi:MAG: hypothetical protein ACLR2M_06655 [Varibaculum sp.]